jgi:3-hydroxybutyryl-CoA dehydrogenase
VVGVHFFNPAPMMSLVEIIRPLTASDETVAAVTAFAAPCGKDPVEVKDRAGFIVNALLFPYLNNAVRMLGERHRQPRRHRHRHEGRLQLPDGPARAARPGRPRHVGGHPRRPLRRVPRPELRRRAALRRMVAAGHLGRKSGLGFYDYTKQPPPSFTPGPRAG